MSQEVESQYQVLAEIRKLDERLFRLQTSLNQIPTELSKHEKVLSEKQAVFEQAKALFDKHTKRLREAEQELKIFEDKIKKAEDKLMEVKTNEAYTAAISEINGQKAEKSKLEDEMLKLMSDLDQETKKFKESEAIFKQEQGEFNEAKKRLQAEAAELNKQREELDGQKSVIAEQLETGAAALYTRISTRTAGPPVVEISQGMCTGCRIKIRPQLYNEILGFTAVKQCPSCGKILIPAPPKAAMDPASGMPTNGA